MTYYLDTWEWFGHRTYHHSQFTPLSQLKAAKRRSCATVSVCIPARDEAETIGKVVRTIRRNLMDRVGLVDEVVVMDAGSRDDTASIAAAEGAKVYCEADVLPDAGPGAGKGEALWKSLHVTSGDLICWIDADIRNIHPRFVYGLLGPLLAESGITYVKGFYERPLLDRCGLARGGGGRVTELTARPLLSLFWPQLAGLVQPLAGEYAGRREVLEQVPFSTGYGVELGLLVDIAARWGIASIAQVDLDRRVHRNQDMQALSRMSFGILQAALTRLAGEGRLEAASWSTTLYQFTNRDRGYHMEPHDLAVGQRPPMITVDAYRREREREPLAAAVGAAPQAAEARAPGG
jgi:glucosyl-3-phosphoglycerate synthase